MNEESYSLPQSAAPSNHGRTPASWTLLGLVVAGAIVGGIGMVTYRTPVLIFGLVIIAAGIVASLIMRGRGLGQPVQARITGEWYADDQPA
ncbi:MAG TPA: HGxxPAAW family protein [Actinomycetaceae bacterium]|nr:HGxxPAAW family protein [Actinomycetaceae bacterium]